MRWFAAPDYWFARLAFQRGLAVIYLIAFAAAARQFRPLLGERGLLPIPAYSAHVPVPVHDLARTPGDRGLVASVADPRLRSARHPAAAGSGNLTCDP